VYPDSGIEALHDFSMHVKAGESVAILGTTGSGKSTVANLLCRMYDTTEGQIKVDGFELKNGMYKVSVVKSAMYLKMYSYFLILSKTMYVLVADMSDEQVIQATKDADLYNNIMDFPEQFDTVLGERGVTLSGGQKQRLSIARAIAKVRKFLFWTTVFQL
jgi:ATP-binding cassette subfamily B protein